MTNARADYRRMSTGEAASCGSGIRRMPRSRMAAMKNASDPIHVGDWDVAETWHENKVLDESAAIHDGRSST